MFIATDVIKQQRFPITNAGACDGLQVSPPELWGQRQETQAGAGLPRSWGAAAFDAQALCCLVAIVLCLPHVFEGVFPLLTPARIHELQNHLGFKRCKALTPIFKTCSYTGQRGGSLSLELPAQVCVTVEISKKDTNSPDWFGRAGSPAIRGHWCELLW